MRPRTSWHTAFGLAIASEVPLAPYFPILEPAGDAVADLEITLRSGQSPVEAASDAVGLRWPGLARVVVTAGRRVELTPETTDAAALADLVVASLLPVVLEHRGTFVLHASVVARQGLALAFAAASGVGKSTLALAFTEAGFDLIADDIAVLRVSDGTVRCVAGPTLLKLEPQVTASVPRLEVVGRETVGEKLLCRAAGRALSGEEVALAAIYLVADGPVVSLEPCRGREALVALLGHAFCLQASGRWRAAARLTLCEQIGRQVPIWHLTRPRQLDRRHEVVDAVLAKLGRWSP